MKDIQIAENISIVSYSIYKYKKSLKINISTLLIQFFSNIYKK